MALRAQACVIERRLGELLTQVTRLDRPASRSTLERPAPHAL
jgi:hypothetical protein